MQGGYTVELEGKSETQGGGHGRISQCRVVIPCISKPLDHREGNAYKLLQNTPLSTVIPKFYGINDGCIIISDLTSGFSSPCLADFKIGTRHYDLQATKEKIEGLIKKQKGSTTDSHGIRLIDVKTRKNGEVIDKWDKKQGLKLSFDELKDVVKKYVPPSLVEDLRLQIQIILGKIAQTRKENPGFRMYAGSVLIAYDGDHLEKGVRSCLIDFAHTYINVETEGARADDPSLEDNILLGVRSLINLLP